MLKLKIGAKVMLTVNINIQYRLIIGQKGIANHIEFAQGSICKLYITFSDKLRFQERNGQHRHPSSVLNFH